MTHVRPRGGWIQRSDGSQSPVRFIPTDDPLMFLAVTPEGDRAELGPLDTITADVLGPGQSITITLKRR